MGLGGFDHPAGEHDFDGPAFADQLSKTLGAAIAGDEAEVDFGLAEFGRGNTKADMTGHCQLAAAAEGKAVDGRDDRLRAGGNPEKNIGALCGELLTGFFTEALKFGDVRTCNKGLRAGAGEDL